MVDDSFIPILRGELMTQNLASYALRIKGEVDGMFYCVAASGAMNYSYVVIHESHPLFNQDRVTTLSFNLATPKAYNEVLYFLLTQENKIYDKVLGSR
jgi:hypothetical protein